MKDDANELLTIESFGEMFIRQRLQDGLFSNEGDIKVYYTIDGKEERYLSADDLAREVGYSMLPFLSSHPDVGFDSFRKSLHSMVRHGKVISHVQETEAPLVESPLHRQCRSLYDTERPG